VSKSIVNAIESQVGRALATLTEAKGEKNSALINKAAFLEQGCTDEDHYRYLIARIEAAITTEVYGKAYYNASKDALESVRFAVKQDEKYGENV